MVADADTGKFLSIRTENTMILIRTRLVGSDLVITAPDMNELTVSLSDLHKKEGKQVPARFVCKKSNTQKENFKWSLNFQYDQYPKF